MTNDKIINNWLASVPNSIAKYLQVATTPCEIALTKDENIYKSLLQISNPNTPYPLSNIVIFNKDKLEYDNEIYDLGNNYNNASSIWHYLVPFSGNYSFEYKIPISIKTQFPAQVLKGDIGTFTFKTYFIKNAAVVKTKVTQVSVIVFTGFPSIKFVDENGNLLPRPNPPFDYLFNITDSHSLGVTTGEKISIAMSVELRYNVDFCLTGDCSGGLTKPPIDMKMLFSPNNYFRCLGAEEDATTIKIFDPTLYRAVGYSFEKNIPLSDFNIIELNKTKRIIINEGSNPAKDKTAWIDKLSYKFENSETNFNLIT